MEFRSRVHSTLSEVCLIYNGEDRVGLDWIIQGLDLAISEPLNQIENDWLKLGELLKVIDYELLKSPEGYFERAKAEMGRLAAKYE